MPDATWKASEREIARRIHGQRVGPSVGMDRML